MSLAAPVRQVLDRELPGVGRSGLVGGAGAPTDAWSGTGWRRQDAYLVDVGSEHVCHVDESFAIHRDR